MLLNPLITRKQPSEFYLEGILKETLFIIITGTKRLFYFNVFHDTSYQPWCTKHTQNSSISRKWGNLNGKLFETLQ